MSDAGHLRALDSKYRQLPSIMSRSNEEPQPAPASKQHKFYHDHHIYSTTKPVSYESEDVE